MEDTFLFRTAAIVHILHVDDTMCSLGIMSLQLPLLSFF